MMIKIDKNIPIPPSGHGKWNSKYPFVEMEVGDSFTIACDSIKKLRTMQASLIKCASQRADSSMKKFTTRIDKEKMEVRIWRIK